MLPLPVPGTIGKVNHALFKPLCDLSHHWNLDALWMLGVIGVEQMEC